LGGLRGAFEPKVAEVLIYEQARKLSARPQDIGIAKNSKGWDAFRASARRMLGQIWRFCPETGKTPNSLEAVF